LNTHRTEKKDEFRPTFTGGRNEQRWIEESLGSFFADGWLTDVLYRVKGGKEATVYCCKADPATGHDLIAAKVFRPRMFRAMRNDSLYKLGRGILDSDAKSVYDARSLRALKRKSRFGKKLDTASWCQHEFGALVELHGAGADVPRPLATAPNAILMEYIGDSEQGAPVLHSLRLDQEEAKEQFDRLIENVEILLSCFRVHADLSAYNVLYWQGDICIIDLPQVIDTHRHPDAFNLFARDLDRLCRYFTKCGLPTDPIGLAHELWGRWIGW
jgi:RIO kinase 1